MILKQEFESTVTELDIEETSQDHELIVPNMTPYEAIRFLMKYADSKKYPSISDYLFWMDNNGYHFKTMQALLDKVEVKEIYYDRQQSLPESIKNSGYSPSGKHIDFLKVESYTFNKTNDGLMGLIEGLYDSKLHTIDVLERKFETHEPFLYDKEWDTFKLVAKSREEKLLNKGGKLHSDKSVYKEGTEGDSHIRYIYLDKAGRNYPFSREEFLLRRTSSFAQMNSIEMTITIPGDSNRNPR